MRYLKITFLAALFFFFLAGAVSSGTRDADTDDSKHVEFGKKFKAVVRFRAVNKKQETHYGSAVIIRPHWVLTAAHATADTTEPAVLTNDDADVYPLVRVVQHASFDPDINAQQHDIALGYSEKDFGLAFYIPLYKGSAEEGKIATLAGYGMGGTFASGRDFVDGKRRAGSNHIERARESILICSPSAKTDVKRTSLEFFIASGDSGGGLFIGNELAGIHSFVSAAGQSPKSKYGEESGHTRVSLYVDWVESEIKKYESERETNNARYP